MNKHKRIDKQRHCENSDNAHHSESNIEQTPPIFVIEMDGDFIL